MKRLFTLLCFLLLTLDANSQNWLWGKSGGGDGSFTESVIDMAVDPNNNVYVLSTVDYSALKVDGHTKTSYGGTDIMLVSFSCDGSYRWSKVIGGWSNDIAKSLKTDTLGHVYLTGYITSAYNTTVANVHFDTDTIFTTPNIKRQIFIAQYDTSGTYKWLRMPQSDTVGAYSYSNSGPIDLSVDENGNIFWLCELNPGAYVNGTYIVSTQGIYILKYDRNGNFTTGFPMQIFATNQALLLNMQRDPKSKRFYISGNLQGGTLSLGGNPVTHAIYISAFDSAGHFIWKKEDTQGISAGFDINRVAIDTAGDIYMNGSTYVGDVFLGHLFTNTGSSGPFALKMDSSGTLKWAQFAFGTAPQGSAIAVTTNNEVVLLGDYPGTVEWPGFTGWHPGHVPNQGYDMYITRFNAQTGAVIANDTLGSDFGNDDFASNIVADRKGNVYIGGQFSSLLHVAGTTLQSIGSPYDFVVAKYGFANCNCTSTPTANFTYTANSATHIANFTFTGTMPVDSVHWTFGDGGTSNQTNPSHTYANNNSYNVCVTVYTPCGSNTYCHQATTSVGTVYSFPDVSIYPNPVKNQLHIDNLKESASYRIVNLIGSIVQQGTLQSGSNEISLKEIPSGIYLLQLTDNNGAREVQRIVKE